MLLLRKITITVDISIHALLAESDIIKISFLSLPTKISIHALLAESDAKRLCNALKHLNFYPRSPCGERLVPVYMICPPRDFYPRSPCGERP